MKTATRIRRNLWLLHQSSRMGGQIFGQGAGGVLFSALGAAGAFFLNSLSFFVSSATGVWIKVPRG